MCCRSRCAEVSIARDRCAHEGSLYEALIQNRIGGAGLDVFSVEPPDPTRPVFQFPNVYVTPHTASATDGTSRKRAQFAAENLDRYARGEEVHARIK